MDIEKLKQKILDLAIRGKLVPQDPNDEPSSVLIEKIKNEKNELIKQGKIKPTKDDSYIYRGSDNCYYEKKGKNTYNISKEIPFDIPNSWIWTRLSVLTSKIQYGLNYPSKMSGKNKYLRITDIQNNQVNWENVPYVNITKDEEGFLLNNNDIVFARTGATVGKSFLVINPPIGATFASYLIRIVINDYDIAQYLYSFFQSSFYWNQIIDKAIGSTQPNCNGTKLASLLVPVPPLCEIKKINEKINMILPKIENIIKLKKDTLSLVESLKKAILSSFFDSENSTYKSYYENEYKLGDLLQYEQPGPFIVKSTKYNDKYVTPVLTPGKSFILGYTNESDGIYKVEGSKVIIFDDFTTASRLIDFDFKVKSSAMKILHTSNKELFDIDYLFYKLQTINIISDTHKRFWISEYSPLKVKIHTINEQKKIVEAINDAFTILNNMSKSI